MIKQKLRKLLGSCLILCLIIMALGVPAAANAGPDRALLIQGALPWNSSANTTVLDLLVTAGKYSSYDIKTTADISDPAYDLSVYKTIIFANDQPQSAYDEYNDTVKAKLEAFAFAGGVVIFGVCDQGWAGGTLSATLPGGITKVNIMQDHNYIVDSTNPIVTGELSDNIPLVDADLVGNACSHVSFVEASLPAGSIVIFRGTDDNLPTLVDYPYGSGHIIASGLTWEYCYERATDFPYAMKSYDDLMIYALNVAKGVYGNAEPRKVQPTTILTNSTSGIQTVDLEWLVSTPDQWQEDTASVEFWLDTTEVTAATADYAFIGTASTALSGAGLNLLKAFNIDLMQRVTKTSGAVAVGKVGNADIKGNITVRIPIPKELLGLTDLGIVYIDENGATATLTTKRVTIAGVDYLEFANNHFSVYGIVSGSKVAAAAAAPAIPKTGEHDNLLWGLLLLTAGAALGLGLLKQKRALQ